MNITKRIPLSYTALVGLIAVLIESCFFLTYEGGILNGVVIQYFIIITLFFLVIRRTVLSSSTISVLIAIVVYILLTVFTARIIIPFGLGAFILLASIALMRDNDKRDVFVAFKWIIVAISTVSFILYLFAWLNITVIPYRLVQFYEEDAPMNYRVYLGCIGLLDYGIQIRNCGVFNEPGLFGTVIALFLCADHINLRKPSNIILLVTGFTTLSVAFIISLFIYIVISSFHKRSNLFVIIILMAISFFFLPKLNIEDDGIIRLLSRLSFEEGVFVGDDRTSSVLDQLFTSVMNSDLRYFGLGSDYFETHPGYMSSSFKSWIIEYGLIGSVLMWGTLLFSSLKFAKKNVAAVLFIVVFFLNVYQRPQIYSLMYFVTLFGGIIYIRDSSIDSFLHSQINCRTQ